MAPLSRSSETALEDRDARAVLLAEARWPGRYIGDLSTAEWRRVYEELDRSEGNTDG